MKFSTIAKSVCSLFFIQPFLMADPFTFEDAEAYHHKAIVQWNSAMQAIHDHPLDGNESVLDIGCGDGKVTAYLAEHLSSGKILVHIEEDILPMPLIELLDLRHLR